ncbi:hypothetical protein CYMTET_24501 [Cymbomonas tetramitiformis]|uniref:Uncharacterized protein n=1 Tax=Cymbomonas tetramitiformis TaxID=36881 RepID=A0AAE0FW69_9CHLO|nr:hypothetical protein CYMTET_24501 [Cymbomonas tetramitiformis]
MQSSFEVNSKLQERLAACNDLLKSEYSRRATEGAEGPHHSAEYDALLDDYVVGTDQRDQVLDRHLTTLISGLDSARNEQVLQVLGDILNLTMDDKNYARLLSASSAPKLLIKLGFLLGSSEYRIIESAATMILEVARTARGCQMLLNRGDNEPAPLEAPRSADASVRILLATLSTLIDQESGKAQLAAAEILLFLTQSPLSHPHLWEMPEPTFVQLLRRLVKHLGANSMEAINPLAAGILHNLTAALQDRVLASAYLPELIHELTTQTMQAQTEAVCLSSAKHPNPARLGDGRVEALMRVVGCSANVVASLAKSHVGRIKVLTACRDAPMLFHSLLGAVRLHTAPDACRAAGLALSNLLASKDTVKWVWAHPRDQVAPIMTSMAEAIGVGDPVAAGAVMPAMVNMMWGREDLHPVMEEATLLGTLVPSLVRALLSADDATLTAGAAVFARLFTCQKTLQLTHTKLLVEGPSMWPEGQFLEHLVLRFCSVFKTTDSSETSFSCLAAAIGGILTVDSMQRRMLRCSPDPAPPPAPTSFFGSFFTAPPAPSLPELEPRELVAQELAETVPAVLVRMMNSALSLPSNAAVEILHAITAMPDGTRWLILGTGQCSLNNVLQALVGIIFRTREGILHQAALAGNAKDAEEVSPWPRWGGRSADAAERAGMIGEVLCSIIDHQGAGELMQGACYQEGATSVTYILQGLLDLLTLRGGVLAAVVALNATLGSDEGMQVLLAFGQDAVSKAAADVAAVTLHENGDIAAMATALLHRLQGAR